MTVDVRELAPAMESAWRAYVAAHPQGTLFHELEWMELLRRTFKHETRYLLARRDGNVVGVLPLVAIRSLFFGRSVVSVPFGVYGGVLADDPEAARALVDASAELAREVGAGYVELRHLHVPPGLELPSTDLYATFIRDLPPDPAACLGLFPRKARAEVRKARERPGVSVTRGPLDLDEFHRLFALNKRKLGSPVFPKSLFLNLRQIYGDRLVTVTVRREGVAVASVLNFLFRDTLMAYYSGALEDANRISANNLMYADAMEHAVERGLSRFDFGRSRRETGSFAFKKNQGFEPRPLAYQFVLEPDAPVPSVNASNPRYDFAKKLFRILPTIAAEKLGSFVAKRMPV